MSRSRAQIYCDGKLVAFGLYNGTVDIMYRELFRSSEDAWHKYDRGKGDLMIKECTCGGAPTLIVVYSDYGSGTWWDSEACLQCMVLTGNIEPYELVDWGNEEMVHGKPPFFVDQWSLD